MERIIFGLVSLQIYFVLTAHGLDRTLEEFASGNDVLEAVFTKIDSACIFQDDKELLRRISYVETKDGLADETFTSNTHKGVWRMDALMYNRTLEADEKFLTAIKQKFQINWHETKLQDLQKPFHAGLAAHLYLFTVIGDEYISRDVEKQARQWTRLYNPNGDEKKFIEAASSLESGCSKGIVDLVILVDSSASIGRDDFLLMKDFLKVILATLNVGPSENEHTRVAVISFGDDIRVEFRLDSHHSLPEYDRAIDAIEYMEEGTNTHLALKFLVEKAFTPEFGARPQIKGVPKLGLVLTDGMSTEPEDTLKEAVRVLSAGINLVSVGIGDDIDDDELMAMASEPSCRHKFILNGFLELDFITDLIKKQTCEAPVKIWPDGGALLTKLPPETSRSCKITVSKNGTTIKVYPIDEGSVNLYLSRSVYPNPANFDVKLKADRYHPAVEFLSGYDDESLDVSVYCLLEGDERLPSTINISAQTGNHNPCQPLNPCQNDGTCIATNTPEGYRCSCLQKFSGTNCQEKGPLGFNCQGRNPCTLENVLAGKFHFAHDEYGKFVQCSESRECHERNCRPSHGWNADVYTCLPKRR